MKTADTINTIAIIGAGRMGCGIAQVFALNGFRVRLSEQDRPRLEATPSSIGNSLAYQVARKYIKPDDQKRALAQIDIVSSDKVFSRKSLKDCDLIIEAIAENEEEKCALWRSIAPHLAPETILASATSGISITRLGAASGHAEHFIGLHFMNPAPAMKLVEIVRGIATTQPVIDVCRDLVTKIGKISIMSEDFPAFIVNRILLTMINEAVHTLYEGVGSVESIDLAMRFGANHPMGPLALADFMGLDTCLHSIETLHKELADGKYRPCPLLVKYVEAGWLGVQSGRGFYDYSGDTPTPTR